MGVRPGLFLYLDSVVGQAGEAGAIEFALDLRGGEAMHSMLSMLSDPLPASAGSQHVKSSVSENEKKAGEENLQNCRR